MKAPGHDWMEIEILRKWEIKSTPTQLIVQRSLWQRKFTRNFKSDEAVALKIEEARD